MRNNGALATLDDDAIVQRIASGEYQSHIARELGVAPQSLHARITKHPKYRDALKARNSAKLDDAQEDIETAPQADLARARESWKAATWRAERECPDEWGQRTQVDVTIDIGSSLQAISERRQARIIDAVVQQTVENVAIEPTEQDDSD